MVELERIRRPVTGRELAVRVGASQEGVRVIVRELESQGIVRITAAGRSRLIELNREHLVYPLVNALSSLKPQLYERMRQHCGRWSRPKPVAVIVFGSLARGDASATSDIDLLVVRPAAVRADNDKWVGNVSDLMAKVTSWTGNHCEVLEYSVTQLRRMAKSQKRLYTSIDADGVVVFGQSLTQLVRTGAA